MQLANGKDVLCQQIEPQYSLYTYITCIEKSEGVCVSLWTLECLGSWVLITNLFFWHISFFVSLVF